MRDHLFHEHEQSSRDRLNGLWLRQLPFQNSNVRVWEGAILTVLAVVAIAIMWNLPTWICQMFQYLRGVIQ